MFKNKRLSIAVLGGAALACLAVYWIWTQIVQRGTAGIDATDPTQVEALHDRILTVDSHVDIPLNWATTGVDPATNGRWPVDLGQMREGGLDAAFFVVYVGQGPRDEAGFADAVAQAMTKFAAIHRMTSRLYPDQIGLAYTSADVQRLVDEGKLAALIGIENGYTLGGRLERLRLYRDLGARYIGLIHNGHNELGDSAQPKPDLGDEAEEYGGLSPFGRQVVREANRLGIMVDVSHASKKTTLDAVKHSRTPVIASHSSVYLLRNHARNLDDETIAAIAAKGGVIQIVAYQSYLSRIPAAKKTAFDEANKAAGLNGSEGIFGLSEEEWQNLRNRRSEIEAKWPAPNTARFVDHIDHVVRVAGIDHVGIASDFGGGGGIGGWMDISTSQVITQELLRRGYTENQVAQIWGGNLLRVLEEVERKAKD